MYDRVQVKMNEISYCTGFRFFPAFLPVMEKIPRNRFFSRVETRAIYDPVCQITADMHSSETVISFRTDPVFATCNPIRTHKHCRNADTRLIFSGECLKDEVWAVERG